MDTPIAWHALPAAAVLERLQASAAGLTEQEAQRRVRDHGPNRISLDEPTGYARVLIGQFRSFLIWLLVGAAVGLVIGAVMKVAYDVLLYRAFRSTRAPEETVAGTGSGP